VLHTPNGVPKTTFKATHVRGSVRQLTCDEADCTAKAMGWRTVLPIPAQLSAVNFIRAGKTGRRFKEAIESEGLVTFYFGEGQNCFETHWQRDPTLGAGLSATLTAMLSLRTVTNICES
jgi:hypothetical protein